jgi:hypothetical protein
LSSRSNTGLWITFPHHLALLEPPDIPLVPLLHNLKLALEELVTWQIPAVQRRSELFPWTAIDQRMMTGWNGPGMTPRMMPEPSLGT